MKLRKAVLLSLVVLVGGCLSRPTIDEEVAAKCGLSVRDYQRIEADVRARRDTAPVRAGRCRLNRTRDGNVEGEFQGG